MIVVELTDYSGKLHCAFFGKYVDSLNAFIAAGDLDQPIVVVQLAKVKTFKGKVVIQNVMHAMKLIFNPDIAEAIDLRCRLAVVNLVGSQTISFLPHGQLVSLADNFMKLHPRKSLEQLIEVKEDGHFIVMATVKGIVEDGDSWWYVACNYGRAVTPDSGMYYCDVCFTHVFNVNPRYRVKIEVEDTAVIAVLVLFDRDGQLLFKRTCAEMITEAKRGRSCYSKLRPNLSQQANMIEYTKSNVSVMMTPLLPCSNFLGLRIPLQRPCSTHHSLRFPTWAVMNLEMIQLLLRIFPPKCLMKLFALDLLKLLLMLRSHLQRENLKKL